MHRRGSTRLAAAGALAVLLPAAAGCGDSASRTSGAVRPCDVGDLRLHGAFQGALGSQFGAVTISATGRCSIHGGRPVVIPVVGKRRFAIGQEHDPDIPLSDGPHRLTITTSRSPEGPGFRFEWFGTCLPRGTIGIEVRLPGLRRALRVAHTDHLVGPRCDAPGTKGTVNVSLLGRDASTMLI